MATIARSFLSLQEAQRKCQEKHSSFQHIEQTEHICLPPCYIGRLKVGIDEELSKKLMKFCDNLQGVIVAYDKIQLLQRHAKFMGESPFLHFGAKVNYIVFKPEVNSKLIGVVNKLGHDHIGCLVHGCFNASILKPTTDNDYVTDNLVIGSSFVFRVLGLESLNGVLLISGAVNDKSLLKRKTKLKSVGKTEFNNTCSRETTSETLTEGPGKSKKHKKERRKDEMGETPRKKKKHLQTDVNGNQKSNEIVNNEGHISSGNSKTEEANLKINRKTKKKKSL